jgi:hypothetical protein
MTFIRKAAAIGGVMLLAGATLAPQAAHARVWVGFGFGAPYYWGPGPYYYAPRVVYAPPPVVYAPPPPRVAYIAPHQDYRYYCSNPQGYYPAVQSCSLPWQEVPNAPPAAR